MKRREWLAMLASSSLVGCTGLFSGGDEPRQDPFDAPTRSPDSTTPTETPTETPHTDPGVTPTETPDRVEDPIQEVGRASVVEATVGPRTYAITRPSYRSNDGARVYVRFVEPPTDEGPARVRAVLRNDNSFPNTFRLDETPPFGRAYSQPPEGGGHEKRLVFVPAEGNPLAREVPGYRQGSDGYWHLESNRRQWLPETKRLEPRERVEGEFLLVGAGGPSGRPTGTYQFSADRNDWPVVVWNTDLPGPADGSRFDVTVPPLSTDDDETGRGGEDHTTTPTQTPTRTPSEGEDTASGSDGTVWYHEASPMTGAYLWPERERATLPAAVEFTAVNNSHETLACGGWNLYKLHDGDWYHLAPRVHYLVCRMLGPGSRDRWTIHAFEGEGIDCEGNGITAGHLGGGRYAVSADYGTEGGSLAALVDLVGDPVVVTPTDDAETVREGEVVTVTTSRYGDGEHPPSATLTVTRVDAGTVEETYIPEQVMRPHRRGIRNALAAFEDGVRRVVVRTDERAARWGLGHEEDAHRFRFEGETYEAVVEREETGMETEP